ncbi:histidine phosphatase family protein [Cryptosporangium arvum]|uniref:phosphoglycerate mutase (2,3-diphosphoglycerate-dependent) n=1 Tax=Cryptosporangium arvum DSM 44712 TaxID=927661 RepID=A0A010ZQ13_9ACTN|nr:histidine phosphatase family protein [Cryptosporangium arvum]EXG79277.1 fructose-2,6-bisphosphatase [Cryptosporangium arvum DSM 44712]
MSIPGFPAPAVDVAELTVVRHGQSLSNELLIAANQAGVVDVTGLPARDADVPLSVRGRREAAAVGRWAASLDNPPDLVIASPYQRAQHTAQAAVDALTAAGRAPEFRLDDRVRDREIGILTLLTEARLRADHPEEAARREATGFLYYRPPGGEAHTDMAIRLRSFLTDLGEAAAGRRVLVVAHDSVVVMLRYVIEGLVEADVAAIAASGGIKNGSVTRWERRGWSLRLTVFNSVAHLD